MTISEIQEVRNGIANRKERRKENIRIVLDTAFFLVCMAILLYAFN